MCCVADTTGEDFGAQHGVDHSTLAIRCSVTKAMYMRKLTSDAYKAPCSKHYHLHDIRIYSNHITTNHTRNSTYHFNTINP